MNSGATSERVYDGLKRRILTRAFRPGDRLDPALLSDTLSSSVTPVRDALHILVGESLVETRTGEGFHLPPIDAPALQDLYGWNAQLLALSMRSWKPGRTGIEPPFPLETQAEAIAEAAATLFARIGQCSTNIEHRRAIASANDRLHAARIAECEVLDGLEAELDALRDAAEQDRAADLRAGIAAYHRRRARAAAEIVRTLYRHEAARRQPAENNLDIESV